MKFSLLIIIVIFTEIVALFFIIKNLIKKSQNPIKNNVSILNNKSLIFFPDKNLENFYDLRPNYSDIQNYSWLPHKTIQVYNKEGLNDLEDYSRKKPINTYRIITLGDSYTYGAFVDTKENWTEILETKLNSIKCDSLNKIEVINLGVSGYDIEFAAHRYGIKGVTYNPDLILWFVKDDDFAEIRDITAPIKSEFISKHKKEWEANPYKINIGAYRLGVEKLSKKYKESDIINYQIQVINTVIQKYKHKIILFDLFPLKESIVMNLNKFLTKNKQFTFYYSPNSKLNNSYNTSYSFYPNDSHPNQKGHQVIAEELFDYLTKNNIILCNK